MDKRWTFFTADIELTSICGQNCLFCPRDCIRRPPGFMESGLFAEIIRQLAEIGSRVTFCGMGNPLLHPDLAEFGAICRRSGIRYGLTIQAPALDRNGIEKINALAPSFVEISVPTLDPALFSRLYPGQILQDALTGLHNLAEARGSTRGISITAVRTAWETMSSEEISEFWAGRGLNCRQMPCHSRGGHIDRKLTTAVAAGIDRCGLFATHAFITWQGELLACCHDLGGITRIADLADITIMEAAARKVQILEGTMPFPLCASCDEQAARRPLPERDFPESEKARARFLKKHCRL